MILYGTARGTYIIAVLFERYFSQVGTRTGVTILYRIPGARSDETMAVRGQKSL